MADVDEAKRCQVEAQCARDGLKIDNQRIRTVLQELQNRGVDMPNLMEDSRTIECSDMVQDYLDKIADLQLENKRLRLASYMQNVDENVMEQGTRME